MLIMKKHVLGLVAAVVAAAPLTASAATSFVNGGITSVLPGNGALASVGLEIVGIAGDTIAPGELSDLSVAFGITDATTFSYDAADFLGTFSGTIEHSGGIVVADTATGTTQVTIGDFTIGFDAGRIGGDASGFFVADNIDTGAILFDIGSPVVEAFDEALVVTGNLLISSEFSGLLNSLGLVDVDVSGVDAGLALVDATAAIPLPAAVWLFGGAVGALGFARRRAA
jgi:hypothetical protein